MEKSDFEGIMPAITTKMTADQNVDHDGVAADVEFQIAGGVDAVIVCGSLGEASTLTADEKLEIAQTAMTAASSRVPVLLTVAEDSTRAAIDLSKRAEKAGVAGLMVLPAMRYLADPRETVTHFKAVAQATGLPIIVYNNPVAYGIDVTPEMLAELAPNKNLVAVKESTGDVRRVTDTINALGDRYRILTGVDDLALESLVLGCDGWIAGLCVAFPKETVAIYRLVGEGRVAEALEIYRWFMPLLHLDTSTKFVQYIKMAEAMVRGTSTFVRAPRLELTGEEERRIRETIATALENRVDLSRYADKKRA
jgi:4-hydroxy-tetrahydrodipicolinate synthase